jgi:iron complex transport system substrate-binding protein
MTPDLVIHSNDIGPETVLPQITKAGLNIKAFGGANTIDSAKLLLKELGKFFGVEKKADSLINLMNAGIAKAADTLKALNIKDSLKVMIIHFGLRNNNYFVMSGRNGVGDKMIRLAGCTVALYNGKGTREMSAEAVALANPDIIIATDFGYDRMGNMDKFISSVPGVSLTNAGKNKRIVRFEEHDLIYFGPRTGDNVIKLINLLHTSASAEKK